MVLAGLVGVKTVKGRDLAQLSMAALGRVVGINFENRNSETIGLLLFLALHNDEVLDEALVTYAASTNATAALLATQAAWRVIHDTVSFPVHLERHGDYLVMVSEDRKVRVGVAIPAAAAFRVVWVSFASPVSFETSIIVSTHTVVITEGQVCKDREVLCGGEFWQVIFDALASWPNGVEHLHRLLTRAIATYGSLRYDVVRPPVDFAALASPAMECVDDTTLRVMLDAALQDNMAILSRVQDVEARAFELARERDWLRERVASLEAAAPAPSAAFAPSHRINSQRRTSLPSSLQSPAAIMQPQRRVSLPSSLPPTPVRPGYRPRAALLGAVRPLPARRTPPPAPGPDVEQHASSASLTPGAFMVTQFNSMSPDARLALERRFASPLLMRSYPSPAHSSPFVLESPPFDLSTPPYPPYVSPSSPSSFASTRLVFDAMTPPQTERRPSPPPTEDDDALADRALNMSVDEIDDDENETMANA
ncbi:hypothetical protein SPRG_09220 [Saprolegnia parasitica CBS 223.65]|uniref:Uncharacterized protein n=1 Tax=Saprolegnia parasitica (strain CBS 223.65) TaxID=695850 RepID=A0A067C7D6_SAPPC|nr:hypothetical protein SPRG_09220 [Saprolegnia parasitica CBS 223.65]KDO25080.1 hypothetical protein SPRG_09220 [Saprolegnia parasitica CBS 223.65]|eukprot:XP_012204154.1 hypothetical protein SPRG_09220 [Saprolegnia parasitica CBS 223.65]